MSASPPQLQDPAFLAPVIHSVYIPNKPRSRQQGVGSVDSHVELLSRQHSYNHADYELQKRVKIQQKAKDQLLTENPHLESLLIPSPPSTNPSNTTNNTLATPTPTQSTSAAPAPNVQLSPSPNQPQRRAFGDMVRDGAFGGSQRAQVSTPTPILPGQNPTKMIDNLKNDDLSDSDSFVIIEGESGPGHLSHHAKKEGRDGKGDGSGKEKGLTVSKYGVKTWDNTKPPVGSNHKQLLASNVLHTPNGVDIHLAEPGHEVCLINVDIIKHMQRGITVIKHGRRGKPHTCTLKLAQNCRYFMWESKNKDDGENVIRFPWITAIAQGQNSSVFQRNLDPRVETLSMCVSYSRPEKYYHIEESDDEGGPATKGLSFLPSFFKSNDAKAGSGKRSTWKGAQQDLTLDVVIEDPNDWLIWYNCIKILVDIATTKIVTDQTLTLNRKTSTVLSLPILLNYPSSAWIVDHQSGLTVVEQHENEQHHENNQVQIHLALTRKETYKELIRRTSSYNGGSQSTIRNQLIQRHESQRQLNRQASQGTIGVTTSPPTTATPQSTTLQALDLPLLADGQTPDYDKIDDLDLLSASFPSPWRGIQVKGTSDIVHPSWLQQIIFFGPKPGRSVPWVRAYTMSTTAATYSRVIERIGQCQREELGLAANADPLSQSELGRRERLFKSFLTQCGGLSIIIMRSRGGDVLGGYATAPWVPQWGFYGTPDTFVFSIGQEEVTMNVDNAPAVSTVIEEVESTLSSPGASRSGNTQVVLDEKICQTHIYRWCGNGRFFQFVSQDAFGFGGNISDDPNPAPGQTEQGTGGPGGANNSNGAPAPENTTQALRIGAGSGASQSTGPAFTMSRNLDVGYSLPCPIFHSPQLTKTKQWDCLQFELWIPVPKL